MNQEARSPTSRKNTRNGVLAKTCAEFEAYLNDLTADASSSFTSKTV